MPTMDLVYNFSFNEIPHLPSNPCKPVDPSDATLMLHESCTMTHYPLTRLCRWRPRKVDPSLRRRVYLGKHIRSGSQSFAFVGRVWSWRFDLFFYVFRSARYTLASGIEDIGILFDANKISNDAFQLEESTCFGNPNKRHCDNGMIFLAHILKSVFLNSYPMTVHGCRSRFRVENQEKY